MEVIKTNKTIIAVECNQWLKQVNPQLIEMFNTKRISVLKAINSQNLCGLEQMEQSLEILDREFKELIAKTVFKHLLKGFNLPIQTSSDLNNNRYTVSRICKYRGKKVLLLIQMESAGQTIWQIKLLRDEPQKQSYSRTQQVVLDSWCLIRLQALKQEAQKEFRCLETAIQRLEGIMLLLILLFRKDSFILENFQMQSTKFKVIGEANEEQVILQIQAKAQ